MANKRITQQTETSTLSTGDYALIDNSSGGTKKYDLGSKLNTLTSSIGTLSSLTTTAKTNLVAAINEIKASAGSGSGSGSSGGTNILIVTDSNGTLNKTFNEIKTAINNGTPVFLKRTGSSSEWEEFNRLSPITTVYRYSDASWRVAVETPFIIGSLSASGTIQSNLFKPGIATYQAASATNYPTFYGSISFNSSSLSDVAYSTSDPYS